MNGFFCVRAARDNKIVIRRKKRDGRFADPLPLILELVPRDYPLDNLNVLCLPALGALGYVELDALAFLQ